MKRLSIVPLMALATAICASQAHAQLAVEFNDTTQTIPFLFDFPGNTSSLTTSVGDKGFYEVRDGALVLFSGRYAELKGSKEAVLPNVKVSSTATIPSHWFIETRMKINFDGFNAYPQVGLVIGSDTQNYATVAIKHTIYNSSNQDYFNVELTKAGSLRGDGVQDYSAFYGVNYGYVVLRVDKNADNTMTFTTTYPDGTTVKKLPVISSGDARQSGYGANLTYGDVYDFISAIAGKRVGLFIDIGGQNNTPPLFVDYFRTDLPLDSVPATQTVFREDFDGQDTKLGFDLPLNSPLNTENPAKYSIDHGSFNVLGDGGLYQQYNNASNVANLQVSTTATIPADWYIKTRVQTNFAGTGQYSQNAGMIVAQDADNWLSYIIKNQTTDNFAEVNGELGQVQKYGLVGVYYDHVPQTGYAVLTLQKNSTTGKIQITLNGSNGVSNQNTISPGDVSYDTFNNIAGKRVGLYREAQGLLTNYDYFETNLPLDRIVNPVISGVITFDSINATAAPWQTVSVEFRPVDTNGNPTGGTIIKKTVQVAPTGEFKFYSIPAGNYVMAAKATRYLRELANVNTTTGTVTNVALFLPAGDVQQNDGLGNYVDDNIVNVDDLSTLLNLFNTTKGDGSYDLNPTADLNQDTFIDVDDLSILLYNFNLNGQP